LTTPERFFILIPEGKMRFQGETGFLTAAGRKRKFLSLNPVRGAEEFRIVSEEPGKLCMRSGSCRYLFDIGKIR
jgi:hypothetical protein